MRILITGVSGFVGRRFARRLLDRGTDEVHGFSRTAPEGLTPTQSARLQWHSIDLTDRRAVIDHVREVDPDRVLHLAAMAHPGECFETPGRAYAAQVSGTAAVLCALNPTARALVVSSSQVYGAPTRSPITESAPLNATSTYGRSKRACEHVARDFATRARSIVIARPFNHSGAGQSAHYVLPALAAQVIECQRSGAAIKTGNLYPRRDFLHVDDVLDAYELLLARGQSGRAYNVARGSAISIGELLQGFIKLAGVPLEVREEPTRMRADDPKQIIGDPSQLQNLGWSPNISEQALLRDVYEP